MYVYTKDIFKRNYKFKQIGLFFKNKRKPIQNNLTNFNIFLLDG